MTAAVSVKAVSKSFLGRPVLGDVTFDLPSGQMTVLVGPSGAGKTTLLRCLVGLAALDAGEVFLDDRPLSGLPARRRGIGLVFQRPTLFPHLTALQNVALPVRSRSRSRREARQRAAELLRLVQASDLRDRYPHQLSGGQAQRIALARALAPDPPVLLLDEPFSAVDAPARAALRETLRGVQTELATTMLYVTHDRAEALGMSQRLAVLIDGRLRGPSHPRALYLRPPDLLTARFVGSRNVVDLEDTSAPWTEMLRIGPDRSARWATFLPEDLHLRPAPDGTGVIASEAFAGSTTRLVVRVGDRELVALACADAGEALVEGRRVECRVDPKKIAFFDDSHPEDTVV